MAATEWLAKEGQTFQIEQQRPEKTMTLGNTTEQD